MAEQINDPGFISSLMATLKPKNTDVIPQKWLDVMLANSNTNNVQLKALITSINNGNKALVTQNMLQVNTLDTISKAIGPSFKQTMLDSFKAYDKEFKNSDTAKNEDKKYNERKNQKDSEEIVKNKKLTTDLSKQLSENITSSSIGKGASGDLEGAAAAEAGLAVVQVQPVSIAEIKPEVLESLKKIYTTSINSTPTAQIKNTATGNNSAGGTGIFGIGLSALGDNLRKLGSTEALKGAATLTLLGVALYASAKGFQAFSTVNWEGMAKGFVALLGLVGITKLLASSSVEMIIGAGAIAILGVALIAAGKGFQMFGELDWEAIGKGFTAILGLGAVAIVIGLFSEFAIPGAIAIGILGLALLPFALGLNVIGKAITSFINNDFTKVNEGIKTLLKFGLVGAVLGLATPFLVAAAVGLTAFGLSLLPFALGLVAVNGPLTTFTTQLQTLANISALNILALSGAVVALGAAIAGFGAGAAAAGIGNFVGGLFSKISGAKSPIDQLIEIGQQSANLGKVTSSISELKESLASFGDIKGNLDPLKNFISSVNSVNLAKLIALSSALTLVPNVPASINNPKLVNNLPSTELVNNNLNNNLPTSLPSSLVPTSFTATQAAKLGNLTLTPESKEIMMETPFYKLQETQVRLAQTMVKKMDELINSLEPIATSNAQNASVSNNSNTTTSIINATNANAAGKSNNDISDRDVPYIERNKYRNTMIYARGLL